MPTPEQIALAKKNNYVKAKAGDEMKKAFYQRYYPLVKNALEKTGSKLDPKLVITQMAIESGWRDFSATKTNSFTTQSPFGVQKWKKNQTTRNLGTYEEDKSGNKTSTTKANFVTYETIEDAIDGYIDFIDKNKNYKRAYATTDALEQLKILKEEGYGTENDYIPRISGQLKRDSAMLNVVVNDYKKEPEVYQNKWENTDIPTVKNKHLPDITIKNKAFTQPEPIRGSVEATMVQPISLLSSKDNKGLKSLFNKKNTIDNTSNEKKLAETDKLLQNKTVNDKSLKGMLSDYDKNQQLQQGSTTLNARTNKELKKFQDMNDDSLYESLVSDAKNNPRSKKDKNNALSFMDEPMVMPGSTRGIAGGDEKNTVPVNLATTNTSKTKDMGNDLASKNNNPGNIRVPGTKEFQKYDNLQAGFDALLKQIKMYQDGSSENTTGKETLLELMKIYAPASDKNDPEGYAKYLAEKLNISIDTPISQINTNKLALAIASKESTQAYDALKADATINTGVDKSDNSEFILGNSGQPEITKPSVLHSNGKSYLTTVTLPTGEEKIVGSWNPLEKKVVYGDVYFSEVGTDLSYKVEKSGRIDLRDGTAKDEVIYSRVDDKKLATNKLAELEKKAKTKEGLTPQELIYAQQAHDVKVMELNTELKQAEFKEGEKKQLRTTGVRNYRGIQAEIDNVQNEYYSTIALPELKKKQTEDKTTHDYAIKKAREDYAAGNITKEELALYQYNYDNWSKKNNELTTKITKWGSPEKAGRVIGGGSLDYSSVGGTIGGGGNITGTFGSEIDAALKSYPTQSTTPVKNSTAKKTTTAPAGTATGASATTTAGTTTTTTTAEAGKGINDPDPSGMVAEEVKNKPELAAYFDEEALIKQNKLDQETIDFIKSQKEFNVELPAEEYDYKNLLGNIADVGKGIIGVAGAMQDVPEYQRGDMFKESMDDARRMKNTGLSEQEKGFMKQNAERAYGFATANLRGLSGGSAAAALGGSGEAQRILQGNYGEMAAMDQGIRRQNRAAFAQAAVQDDVINRKIFEDKMTQVSANKAEGAALARDAYTNMNERAQFNQQYGPGSQYQQYMNEQILSQRQAREALTQSQAFQKQQAIQSSQSNIDANNAKIKQHKEGR